MTFASDAFRRQLARLQYKAVRSFILTASMEGPEPLQYELVRQFERRIVKFDVTGTEYRLRVHPLPNGVSYDDAVRLLYDVLDSEF